jgi:hypothetical protein
MGQVEEWLVYIAVSPRLPGRPHVDFIRWFYQFISGTLLLIAVSCLGFYAYLQKQKELYAYHALFSA